MTKYIVSVVVAVAGMVTLFAGPSDVTAMACVWHADGEPGMIRLCNHLDPGYNACDDPNPSSCGPWQVGDRCPASIGEGAVSAKSDGAHCRDFEGRQLGEPGVCDAQLYVTVCTVTAPAITSVTPGACSSRSITVKWNAVALATSYEISINNGNAINVGNVTEVTQNNLTAGQNYSFRVRAVEGTVASSWSAPRSADAPAACAACVLPKTLHWGIGELENHPLNTPTSPLCTMDHPTVSACAVAGSTILCLDAYTDYFKYTCLCSAPPAPVIDIHF